MSPRGRLGIPVGFERYDLGPGKSISFDSSSPHRLWALGAESAGGDLVRRRQAERRPHDTILTGSGVIPPGITTKEGPRC